MLYRHPRVSKAITLRRDQVNLAHARIWVEWLKNSPSIEHPIAGDELRAIKRHLATREDRLFSSVSRGSEFRSFSLSRHAEPSMKQVQVARAKATRGARGLSSGGMTELGACGLTERRSCRVCARDASCSASVRQANRSPAHGRSTQEAPIGRSQQLIFAKESRNDLGTMGLTH